MKSAAWKYCHKKQVVIDGTFGLSTSRLLVWIALGVDETNRGLPVAMFLFSAPTGNKATHAGYDTQIIAEIMTSWRDWMGERNGEMFEPAVAITDTDPKERGGLSIAWTKILLLLCKFHVRQCWTNKRSNCLGKTDSYWRRYLENRLFMLEEALLNSTSHAEAAQLIESERAECSFVGSQADGKALCEGGLKYLDYLFKTWMPESMWKGWSRYGREEAAKRLGIPIEGVIPTTNHLESLNKNLKHKWVPQWQHSGHRLRFDILVFHLVTNILPHIYAQHRMLAGYSIWREHRFLHVAGGRAPLQSRRSVTSVSRIPGHFIPRAWYEPDSTRDAAASVILAQKKLRSIMSRRPYEFWATCESSSSHIDPTVTQYWLTIHPSGAATCTCLDWLNRGGACKHLRAFRLTIQSWVAAHQLPGYRFIFPSSAAEAKTIETHNQRWYGEQYERAVTLPSPLQTSSNGTTELPRPLNLPPHLRDLPGDTTDTILPPSTHSSHAPGVVELDNEAANAADIAAISGDRGISDTDEEDRDQADNAMMRTGTMDFSISRTGCTENIQMVRLQEQQRVEHDVAKILPLLHGIVNIIKSDHAQVQGTQDLFEFRDIVQNLSHLLDQKLSPSQVLTQAGPGGPSVETARGRESKRTAQRTVQSAKRQSSPRALSLERRQKRHKSYSTL
ncbi:hypothetical protein EIP86_000303 [Pleurotus ostreatoroseus]|nr:hypothetical protein EIP86_000303 [Pleurotus ostreatoroseus]